MDVVGCEVGFSAREGRCSDPSVTAVHLQCYFICMPCPWSGCSALCIVPEFGCSAHAVDEVSHKVDALCCDGGLSDYEGGSSDPGVTAVHCSATSAVCSVAAVVAVLHSVSLNVDAVLKQWMQCPTRWMQYVMTDDAVLMKVNAVSLQCLQCPLHSLGMWMQKSCSGCSVPQGDAVYCNGGCRAHEGGCSDDAVVAVPPTVP